MRLREVYENYEGKKRLDQKSDVMVQRNTLCKYLKRAFRLLLER